MKQGGEDWKDNDTGKDGCTGHKKGDKDDRRIMRPVFREGLSDQECGNEERDALEVPGCDPELSREIGGCPGDDPHPFVHEGMDEVEPADEQEGDTDDDEEEVWYGFPCIPDQDEDGERNEDAEQLDEVVKQEVVLDADAIEKNDDERACDDLDKVLRAAQG